MRRIPSSLKAMISPRILSTKSLREGMIVHTFGIYTNNNENKGGNVDGLHIGCGGTFKIIITATTSFCLLLDPKQV